MINATQSNACKNSMQQLSYVGASPEVLVLSTFYRQSRNLVSGFFSGCLKKRKLYVFVTAARLNAPSCQPSPSSKRCSSLLNTLFSRPNLGHLNYISDIWIWPCEPIVAFYQPPKHLIQLARPPQLLNLGHLKYISISSVSIWSWANCEPIGGFY